MNLLVVVLIVLLLFHLLGGYVVPSYRAIPLYMPGTYSLLVIVLLVLVLSRFV